MSSQEGKWVHSKGWEETSGQIKRARTFQKRIHESCTVKKRGGGEKERIVIYRGWWYGWDSRKRYSACVCEHVFLWETGRKTLCVFLLGREERRKGKNPTLPAFKQVSARDLIVSLQGDPELGQQQLTQSPKSTFGSCVHLTPSSATAMFFRVGK